MVFSSTIFLFIFLPVTLAVYFNPFFKSRRFKNYSLLIASLLFYAWGEPVNIFLMLLCIIIGWFLGIQIKKSNDHHKRKIWLTLGITAYLMIFFVMKYLTFVSNQICLFINKDQNIINIALPIGISFYLFQLMSYLFDLYYDDADVQKNIINLGLYISLFPQLIAGPIVRYTNIENQILNRKESISGFSKGMIRFSFGLGKKVLLANYFALMTDNIFQNSDHMSILTAWIGALAYTLQIYFDFSGYSDMAIGLGLLFGFDFPENFNYPYIAKSVTDFWHRWHISLSTWFRDYVYIPMGGNRVSKLKWIYNLFIVWILTGIWHGANWTFLLWGLIYFVILLIEKFIFIRIKSIPSVIGHIYTMFIVILAWVVFRSDSVSQAVNYIKSMFVVGEPGIIDENSLYYLSSSIWIFILGFLFSTPFGTKISDITKKKDIYWIVAIFNIAVFVFSIISCISSTYNPFIYFNF